MRMGSILKKPIREALSCLDKYRDERACRGLYNAKNMMVHDYLSRYQMPLLKENEKKEIDEFWAQYGIKIHDYSWFRWYYGVTGIVDPRFIPQDIYSYIIWPFYDNEEFCLAWKDKNLFEKFCPNMPFPHNYIRRINGRYFDEKGNFLNTEEDVVSVLEKIGGGVIVKDSWDSGEGRGVRKYILDSREKAEKLIREWNHSNN